MDNNLVEKVAQTVWNNRRRSLGIEDHKYPQFLMLSWEVMKERSSNGDEFLTSLMEEHLNSVEEILCAFFSLDAHNSVDQCKGQS